MMTKDNRQNFKTKIAHILIDEVAEERTVITTGLSHETSREHIVSLILRCLKQFCHVILSRFHILFGMYFPTVSIWFCYVMKSATLNLYQQEA